MREEKILNNLGLIYKVMKDLHCDMKNQEEYFFEGLIGLIKGVDNYKQGKSKESAYLYKCIKYAIIFDFKYRSSSKRKGNTISSNITIDKDEEIELQDIIASNVNIEQEIIKKEKIEFILNAINSLKPSYKDILYQYYGINQEPKNMQEIALKYGVSKQNIHDKIKRAIRKIQKKVKKEYL